MQFVASLLPIIIYILVVYKIDHFALVNKRRLLQLVVGGMLMKVAWDLLKDSLGELTDESLSSAEEQEIVNIITSSPDVSEPHNLRTRKIGTRVAIEAHIRMDGDLPLSVAHDHASSIERELKNRFGPDTLVTLHMEPRK